VRLTFLLVMLLSLAAAATPFETFVDDFFENAWFRYQPSAAVAAGFHAYDAKLEDLSQATLREEAAMLRRYLTQLNGLSALSPREEEDRRFLDGVIRARLQDREELKDWETDPDVYQSACTYGAFVIISRTFAPPEERMKSLTARERLMPALLQQARANLKNPPRIATEIALDQVGGSISFFEKDVPSAFPGLSDPEFEAANAAVVRALKDYQAFLKDDLLPRSRGDFRIGAEAFRKKLLYNELLYIPLEELQRIGMADLRKNQEAFIATAARLYPGKKPLEALALLEKDHPPPDQLLQSMRDLLGGLKAYCEAHICTIPSPVLPKLEESPPFMRALTFASMDTPGAYEKKATEAYFHVTLPEKDWPPQEVEEHMAGFNVGTLVSTAVHEAYPGHYVQFLWSPKAVGKVRKLLYCDTNSEGWAHYTEQMMLDEGYGPPADSPEGLKLRLGQLQDALLRNARFIVGLQMHTGPMTFDEGVAFFEKEGYASHANALRETRRGTSDPTYLYYTLGKLEVLRLREDCRKAWGPLYSLRRFHDAFLAEGCPPLPIVRRALLPHVRGEEQSHQRKLENAQRALFDAGR